MGGPRINGGHYQNSLEGGGGVPDSVVEGVPIVGRKVMGCSNLQYNHVFRSFKSKILYVQSIELYNRLTLSRLRLRQEHENMPYSAKQGHNNSPEGNQIW